MMYTAAANQVITNDGTADSKIYTDPAPLGSADRVSGVLSVHYIYGSAAQLTIKTQVSNDGTHWVDQGLDTTASPMTAAGDEYVGPGNAIGQFIRFEFDLNAGGTAAVAFDFHAKLDHA